jgi:hypothetical protein
LWKISRSPEASEFPGLQRIRFTRYEGFDSKRILPYMSLDFVVSRMPAKSKTGVTLRAKREISAIDAATAHAAPL